MQCKFLQILLGVLTSQVPLVELYVEVVPVHGGCRVGEGSGAAGGAVGSQHPVGLILHCLAACIIKSDGPYPILHYYSFGDENRHHLLLLIASF